MKTTWKKILLATAGAIAMTACVPEVDNNPTNNGTNSENAGTNAGDMICTPDATRCNPDADGIEICTADGTDWEEGSACDADQTCVDGVCEGEPADCEPGELKCDGNVIVKCSEDGTAWMDDALCTAPSTCVDAECVTPFLLNSATASPSAITEGDTTEVTITTSYSLEPESETVTQMRGPRGLGDGAASGTPMFRETSFDVGGVSVAADTEVVFEVEAEREGEVVTSTVTVPVIAADMEPVLGELTQIGGASTSVEVFDNAGTTWALFNTGNHLEAIPADASLPDTSTVDLSAYIHNVEIVTIDSTRYAIAALGTDGLAVVDITDPMNMQIVVDGVRVNYYHPSIMFAEGGGAILEEELAGTRGEITDIVTDGTTLWVGNASYGIHRTPLTNLISDTGPTLETDGTLQVEAEAYTLQYAGEHPWGSPSDLTLHNGRLFVAQGFMGLGIFDPQTLEKVGYYNLYTDASVTEDWFVDQDPAALVQTDPGTGDAFIDPATGMPDYRQANFEIMEVWKNDVEAPTPWAEFDRYGKFYYDARSVDVADFNDRSIAYVAYGLGGMVAVDVTGYETADATENFVDGDYLGYAPAIPAHGPEKPTGAQSRSLYPYFGAGMLKEAGVVDVKVTGNHVYYTDHFAGLIVMDGADDPEANWQGPDAPYDNDDPSLADGVLGDHWPDYEFVTSYDMTQIDPDDHDSLAAYLYDAPFLLVTGEITGHGNSLVLLPDLDSTQAGGTDVVYSEGAGGVNFTDVVDFTQAQMQNRYGVVRHFPTTDEVGAAPDGTPTAEISMGHTQGVEVTENYLYVADGPHGVTAWRVTDEEGGMLDEIHVVANTIQFEDPVDVGGETIYPAHHAWGVHYDPARDVVWSMSQSLGMRRIDVADVEAGLGAPGSPLLLALSEEDIFEHNGIFGVVDEAEGQDHTYDVEFRGDLAYVADGSNGLTIYDVTRDPTDMTSGFLVSNFGGEKQQKPPLGRTVGIELYENKITGKLYAFMAAGQRGVGVVDVTDPTTPELVKVFEPIKIEDGEVGHADGRSVDVHVLGDHVYYSYSGFGVIVYTIADLLEPVPDGVDPTEIFKKGNSGDVSYDHRPETVSEFRLHEQPGYEEYDAEALYMTYTRTTERLVFHVAYGHAGVVQIDLTDPANPQLLNVADTIGECIDIAILNGRLFAADHEGGIAQFK